MSVEIVKGDLFKGAYPAIGHGVNIRGRMGAGIAKGFSSKWPVMFEHYRLLCEFKLLSVGDAWLWQENNSPVICNLASQDEPGPHATPLWLGQSLYKAMESLEDMGIRHLALPWIGCGIGGLSDIEVYPIINRIASVRPEFHVTIVEL